MTSIFFQFATSPLLSSYATLSFYSSTINARTAAWGDINRLHFHFGAPTFINHCKYATVATHWSLSHVARLSPSQIAYALTVLFLIFVAHKSTSRKSLYHRDATNTSPYSANQAWPRSSSRFVYASTDIPRFTLGAYWFTLVSSLARIIYDP